jgi:hypothetical protein
LAVACGVLTAAAIVGTLVADRRWPPRTAEMNRQSKLNLKLLNDLRAQYPTLPAEGTLYVANPPPFWNEQQVRESLRPEDRLFVFKP